MVYPIGRGGFHLGSVMIRPKNQIRTELYISGDRAKAFFALLKAQKDTIERELGYTLDWDELPSRRDCRISSSLCEVDPEDETNWQFQHEWLAKRLNDMHKVFASRVRALDADAQPPQERSSPRSPDTSASATPIAERALDYRAHPL